MTEHRWPPQPGDLVKVESGTHPKIASCHAMLGAVCEIRAQCHNDMYEVWQQNKRDFWCFKLSDLSPATPPETIERWGRAYRLVEEESALVSKLRTASAKGVSAEQREKQRESWAKSCVQEPTP